VALVLIGFMGAGKSRSAGRLAKRRGRAPIDGDALLVERFGHSVAREFELHGEQSFRAAEEEVACGLLESADARDGGIKFGAITFSMRMAVGHEIFAADLAGLDRDRVLLWLFARCVQETPQYPALAAVARLLAPA